jgi:ATP-dependent exoDNAse (exonuclease V) alpha subunit
MIRSELIAQQRIGSEQTSVVTQQPQKLPIDERNFSHSHAKGDHFFLSDDLGKFRKGSYGQIIAVDEISNTAKARIFSKGKARGATIDLSSHGHHLSTYSDSEKEFGVGDKIIFLKTRPDLNVQNGLSGTITAIAEDGDFTVQTDRDHEVTFNPSEYAFFDWAYAVTAFRVQGSDTSKVIFHADSRNVLNYNSFYVASSRAKEDIFIYTNDKESFLEKSQHEEVKTSTLDYSWAQPQLQQSLGMELSHSLALE